MCSSDLTTYPDPRYTGTARNTSLITVVAASLAATVTLSRHDVSAGPVVGVLAVLILLAIATVLTVAYVMHLRDRR